VLARDDGAEADAALIVSSPLLPRGLTRIKNAAANGR
jgi:hypothetical protein